MDLRGGEIHGPVRPPREAVRPPDPRIGDELLDLCTHAVSVDRAVFEGGDVDPPVMAREESVGRAGLAEPLDSRSQLLLAQALVREIRGLDPIEASPREGLVVDETLPGRERDPVGVDPRPATVRKSPGLAIDHECDVLRLRRGVQPMETWRTTGG